jgi:hypothetical protein
LGGERKYRYAVPPVEWAATDHEGVSREGTGWFHTINMEDYNIVLGMLWLKEQNPIINWEAQTWCYCLNNSQMIIEESDIFAKTMREGLPIFITINNRVISTRIDSLSLAAVKLLDASFPDEYNDYADVFSEEKAGTLLDTLQIIYII